MRRICYRAASKTSWLSTFLGPPEAPKSHPKTPPVLRLPFGAILGPLGAILESYWGHLGASWGHPRVTLNSDSIRSVTPGGLRPSLPLPLGPLWLSPIGPETDVFFQKFIDFGTPAFEVGFVPPDPSPAFHVGFVPPDPSISRRVWRPQHFT